MGKILVSNCTECTKFQEMGHDYDHLLYKMAKKGKCDYCGAIFGNTHLEKPYNWSYKSISSPFLDKHLSGIASSLEEFNHDFTNPEKTAFIMMKLPDDSFTPREKEANKHILDAITFTLIKNGFDGVRADHKHYHSDLLPNVMTYMEGCGFGIAVFDERGKNNPNVSFEAGYMLSSSKEVCFLKDIHLGALHADVISKLYVDFDSKNPQVSIEQNLSKWLNDTF
ncbi:hypothetical protein [Methanobacterium formicicum]|uniref:Uncharacterized protein n=1 Tax=Methanobacterium formicicum (strain DSM 3637 / PP1) TaxID=1204725 RepID=K2R3W8_METFP|nr:hypothetical protein [Methanobacterium formicicum]EKF85862.1 hypothetical protein A994_07270 [Methanobacterium formicicum DSM 3637]